MVKPVIQALNNIKTAETLDAAKQIAIAFLESADAKKVDNGRARCFLDGLKKAFAGAPDHHREVLLAATTSTKVDISKDFRIFAGFDLTDLNIDTKYSQEAAKVLMHNARILKAF